MQVVALGYLAVMIVGTFLLALPCSSREGTWTGFTDAFMTSTSAACVTGLIPVSTYGHWSVFGQAVLLVLMQVGGLGIMTLMASFTRLLGRNMTLGERKLFMLSTGNDSVGGVTKLIRSVLSTRFRLRRRVLSFLPRGLFRSMGLTEYGRLFSIRFLPSAMPGLISWENTVSRRLPVMRGMSPSIS